MKRDIKTLINDSPMSSFQFLAVSICVMINMLDGFDVLVMAFTATSISNEWSIDNKSLGFLFSAGFIGMAVGAALLSRFADIYGRRKIIVLCLVVVTIGMLAAGMSQGYYMLAAARLFTGLGIGCALASLNCITAEYSSDKFRGLNISILQLGYPVGGAIGGAVIGALIPELGWRPMFILGAILSLLMIPVVIWRLPESMDYLVARRPGNALEKINSLLGKMGHEPIAQLPEPEPGSAALQPGVRVLWKSEYRRATLLLWIGFFMVMSGVYFVLSWTPKLLTLAGLSETEGISGGLILQVGGILGQVIFGLLCFKILSKWLSVFFMFFSAFFMCLFAWFASDLAMAIYLGAFVGFFLFGSINGLYVLSPALYPAEIRTTGIGWGIGVGRIGAIIAPFVTGALLDLGWESSRLYIVFAVPLLLAMSAVLYFSRK